MFELGNGEKNLLTQKEEQNKYDDSNFILDLNSTNDSHAIIANQVKEKSICLDVGCAVGYIGQCLSKEKHCDIFGIEIDATARDIAQKKKCYKKIYDFSITDFENEKYQNFFKEQHKFDYIIFADVLEHIYNPDEIIYRFSKKLNKNGKILVSVPNIAHIDIIRGLTNRKFNYNNKGLLDNTHIRFFTKNSFLEMIEGINEKYNENFSAKIVGKTSVEPSYLEEYQTLYKVLNADLEVSVLQYIFEISCSNDENKINVEYNDNFKLLEEQLKEKEVIQKENEKLKSEINVLNEKILKVQRKNEILTNKFASIKNSKNKLEGKYELLVKKNSELEILINKILNSKSWKITEPLRLIKRYFSKK